MKNLINLKSIKSSLQDKIRDKAISRTETRILIAGRKVTDFTEDELEIIVREEEEKLYSSIKGKSVLAVLAVLGLGLL